MKKTYFFVLVILLASCTSTKSTLVNSNLKALEPNDQVYILPEDEAISKGSELIGNFKVVDGGLTTDCSFNEQLFKAKNEARKAGANLLVIEQLKYPDGWSTCFRIKGKLYYESDKDLLHNYDEAITNKNKSNLDKNANYAMIYAYRPSGSLGGLIGYKIRMDDETVIGRVRNGERFKYLISDFGEHTFWGKTESRDSVVINIEKGKEYYIRCGMKMGVFAARPEIAVIENRIGRNEWNEMSEDNN